MTTTLHATIEGTIKACGVDKAREIQKQIAENNCYVGIKDLKEVHIFTNSKTTRRDLMISCAERLNYIGFEHLIECDRERFCVLEASIVGRAYDLAKVGVV